MSPPSSNSPRHERSPLRPLNVNHPLVQRSPAKDGVEGFGGAVFMPASFISKFNTPSLHGGPISIGSSRFGHSSLSLPLPPTLSATTPSSRREPTTIFPEVQNGPSLLFGFTNRNNPTHISTFLRQDDAHITPADPPPTSSNPTSDTSAPSPNTSQEPSTSRDASSSGSSSEPSPSSDTDTFVLPEEPTREDFLEFSLAGDLTKRPTNKQKWELRCPACADWIPSSIACTRQPSRPDDFQQLHGHYYGGKCKKNRRKQQKEKETQNKALDDNTDDEMEDVEPRIPPPQVTMVNGCTGVLVHWPVTKGTTFETFPFHRIGDKPTSVSFNVEIRDRGGTLVAFSKKCDGTGINGGCCAACRRIPAEVAMLAQLAMDAAPQTNFVYLSDQQKTDILRKRAEEIRQFRVKVCSFLLAFHALLLII
uniref:Uncharacterized protein n=1 Tax=Mycena chlorophos TaxID=658473 RepID=A0ABQ0KY85_MYCCL|nr:predicted protein [Mycena chlorophos]